MAQIKVLKLPKHHPNMWKGVGSKSPKNRAPNCPHCSGRTWDSVAPCPITMLSESGPRGPCLTNGHVVFGALLKGSMGPLLPHFLEKISGKEQHVS